MESLFRFGFLAGFAILSAVAADRQTAHHHPMQYLVSLPEHWSESKTWPVVFIIESANKEFEETARIFESARKSLPFILVTPLVLTNGGPRFREAPEYHYSETVWAEVARSGRCRFDSDGLESVAANVESRYHGEREYFVTGLEAAGHTIWMEALSHPERLRAAALVAPNFQARCLDEIGYAKGPARATLPIRIFGGANDPGWRAGQPLWTQTTEAEHVAAAHGFHNVSRVLVPNKGHEAMAAEVLAYFATLLKK